jgi:hypothetical protein
MCNAASGVCDGPPGAGSITDAATGDSAAGLDGSPIDAGLCFGVGVLSNLCLAKVPTDAVTLSAPINTSVAGVCTQVLPQTGSPTSAPELCVIAGKTITVQGTVTVLGSQALVLIGAETVTVAASAILDASSATSGPGRTGAGANPGGCSTANRGCSGPWSNPRMISPSALPPLG